MLLCGILAGTTLRAEDPAYPPYSWPDYPRYNLQLDHAPIKGWKIETLYRGGGEVYLRESALTRKKNGVKSRDNPVAKGLDENLYFLKFDYDEYRRIGGPPIPEMEPDANRPVFLGWDYHDFSTRLHRWTGERGFSRKYVIPGEFTGLDAVPLDIPIFDVDPASPLSDWQRFLMPVVTAEGGGDYTVINAFDKAGMTVGFIQMAAHTPDDMIPLMRELIGCEKLKRDPYAHPERWFPELAITAEGKLGYRKATDNIVSLEEVTARTNPNDGFAPGRAYFREDFVRFCNPDPKKINQAELQFAARWLMWSMSPKMREAQIEPGRESVVRSLMKLKDVPPRVCGAEAAIAAVLLHWSDGAESLARVARLLRTDSPVDAFLSLESRAGEPGAESIYGKMLSKQKPWFRVSERERQVLNRRVESVRLLFERDPELLARLRCLTFDFTTGELLESRP